MQCKAHQLAWMTGPRHKSLEGMVAGCQTAGQSCPLHRWQRLPMQIATLVPVEPASALDMARCCIMLSDLVRKKVIINWEHF